MRAIRDMKITRVFKTFGEHPNWKENGKMKLTIIVGTRPEIIRLAAVINKCRKYFDTQLWHTGQNYDYNLNGIFFRDLGLADPELYLDAVGMTSAQRWGTSLTVPTRPWSPPNPTQCWCWGIPTAA